MIKRLFRRILDRLARPCCEPLSRVSVYPDRTVIEDRGVRWVFDGQKQCSMYANGEWSVVGPVTITDLRHYSPKKGNVTFNVQVKASDADSFLRNPKQMKRRPDDMLGRQGRAV